MWLKETFRALSCNPKMSLTEQGALWNLLKFAWDKQGITERDLPEISRALREPIETFHFLWPDFLALAEERNGVWMTAEMWEAVDSHRKRITAAKNAGSKSVESRIQKIKDLQATDAQHSLTNAQRIPNGIQPDKDLDKSKNRKKRKSLPPNAGASERANGWTGQFLDVFRSHYGTIDGLGYAPTEADFGQLGQLKKKAEEKGRLLTLEMWERGVKNYFASEVGVRTIMHLATYQNFITYYQHPLDRYGQAVKTESQNGDAASPARPKFTPCGKCNGGYVAINRVMHPCECLKAHQATAGVK